MPMTTIQKIEELIARHKATAFRKRAESTEALIIARICEEIASDLKEIEKNQP